MTTLAELRTATLNILYGLDEFEAPLEDRIADGLGATGETTTFHTPDLWEPDDWVEYQDTGEVTRLISTTEQKRGQRGTTATIHDVDTDVLKNPPFYQFEVERKIREIIRVSLTPKHGVWTWHQGTVSFVIGDHMYDLDQYVYDVALVYQENLDGDERWHPLRRGAHWDVERQLNPAVASQGAMLRLKRVYDQEETVYYLAKRQAHVDDLDNMSDELADIIPYGAAAKLALGRNLQQKSTRRGDDKQFQQDYEGLMSEFLRMRKELADSLRVEVPEEPAYRPKQRRRW